jgi:hypothetical protein
MSRLTVTRRPAGMQLDTRNIGAKLRDQKIVLALGDGLADMAAIPTVGFDGMSLLIPRRRSNSAAY